MSAALVRSLHTAADPIRDALAAVTDAESRARRDGDSPGARRFVAMALRVARRKLREAERRVEAMHIAEAPAGELALDDRRATQDAVRGGR